MFKLVEDYENVIKSDSQFNQNIKNNDLIRKQSLYLISWNDREPKHDIRDSAPEHVNMV